MTLFVNVYERFQAYGGPEEGGWYYDSVQPALEYDDNGYPDPAQPISVKCKRGRQAKRVAKRLSQQYTFDRDNYSSVLAGDNYGVYIEAHPPVFEQSRPYYC